MRQENAADSLGESGSVLLELVVTPAGQVKLPMVIDGRAIEVLGAGYVDSSTDTCTFIVQATVGE